MSCLEQEPKQNSNNSKGQGLDELKRLAIQLLMSLVSIITELIND
ncbi:hypothetical protein QUW29_07935 [Limosilactobacillus vaginalis]|nr:hypothetical protein [Limosilactobacillus vaginalis]MDM8261796.1 hypothetical protein [Limosilactobacillus vaginalis]